MIGKDQISEAMRYTDAISEEMEDLPRYWRERGVDVDALTRCAMQHGLRQVMIMRGMSPNVAKATPVTGMTPAEQEFQIKFAGAWMSGFAVAHFALTHNGTLDA